MQFLDIEFVLHCTEYYMYMATNLTKSFAKHRSQASRWLQMERKCTMASG